VALTHDSRIRYVPNELAAVRQHKVQLVVLVGQAPPPNWRTTSCAPSTRSKPGWNAKPDR
jgi:hypothetical protein